MNDAPADGIAVVPIEMLTTLIFNIDIDLGVMIAVGVCMLIDAKLVAMDTPGITLEFVVEMAYAGDALTDVSAVPITEVVSGTDVDILANENVNGLAVVMTALESTLSLSFCLAEFSRWSMTILDRVCALQVCMPSYHVC